MNNQKLSYKFLIIFLIMSGNVIFPVLASVQDYNPKLPYEHDEPSPPGKEWNISVLFIGEPKLNRPVDVALETQALGDLNYTDVEITLDFPDGFELIGGDTLWKGNPKKDEKINLKVLCGMIGLFSD